LRLAPRSICALAFVALGLAAELASGLYRSARNEAALAWADPLGLPQLVAAVDRVALDSLLRLRPRAALAAERDPVVIGIDEDFLKRVGLPLGLSQEALGQLLATVAERDPRVIVVDVVLPGERFSQRIEIKGAADPPEIALARGLRAAGMKSRVVLARTWDPAGRRLRDILPEFAASADPKGLAAGTHRDDAVVGSALHCPDEDGVTRAYPGEWCQPVRGIRTMSELAAGSRDVRPAGLIDYLSGTPFAYRPASRLIERDPNALSGLAGRPVVIGSVLPFEDRSSAPVPLADWPQATAGEPGVLLQAQMLRTLLNGGPIQPLSPWGIGIVLIAIAAPLVALRGYWACAGAAAMFALACAGAYIALGERSWWPLGGPTLVAALAFALPIASQALDAARERRRLLGIFGGYVSPRVMHRILAGERRLDEAPAKKEVSILFVDIRDFTPLCESNPPHAVVAILSDYRDAFVESVHDAGGTVCTFTGDGLMAIFGAPDDLPNHAEAAVAAARNMVLRARRLAEAAARRGEIGLKIGVGVNCGTVLVGILKASSRHEYSALGDAVNVAARLESVCKECGLPIVVSQAVFARLPACADNRDLGLKGIKGHHPVHAIGIGTRTKPRPDDPGQVTLGKVGVAMQD
jgi:adenylate cyclase